MFVPLEVLFQGSHLSKDRTVIWEFQAFQNPILDWSSVVECLPSTHKLCSPQYYKQTKRKWSKNPILSHHSCFFLPYILLFSLQPNQVASCLRTLISVLFSPVPFSLICTFLQRMVLQLLNHLFIKNFVKH